MIESPYSGDVSANEDFAREVCAEAVARGYAPFAMHLLYPQFLNETDQEERNTGIDCGLRWLEAAHQVWFCTKPKHTLTEGMLKSLSVARKFNIPCVRVYYDGRTFSWYRMNLNAHH